jgi:hypothetical protein
MLAFCEDPIYYYLNSSLTVYAPFPGTEKGSGIAVLEPSYVIIRKDLITEEAFNDRKQC